MKFKIVSNKKPTGDQPKAIKSLVQGVRDGLRTQVLLGVTGSGKTFTMANIIEQLGRPALIIAHNKTLAAQLCNEFKELFPNNSVNYFVSYYDYYQPEAYIVSSDTYIEKELQLNEEIDKLRHSATCSLFERNDVIIVASVSCIYGLGEPKEYRAQAISLRPKMQVRRDDVIRKLIDIQYKRNDIEFSRGTFRVKGDVLDIFPSYSSENIIRIEFFDNEIEQISEIEAISGKKLATFEHQVIFPATHYVVDPSKMEETLNIIKQDLDKQVNLLTAKGSILEAERLKQRVNYDIEMMSEMGYCSGIENYSRYFDGRNPGEPPYTLLDYFPDDFIMFIDESHMTIPQIRAMFNGDRARKDNLVDYGFRLPSAYDNRPLTFEEFEKKFSQLICVSATPGNYEKEHADNIVEQIIRPTGLLDPIIEVKPTKGQIEDLIKEIADVVTDGGRVLVTTLTKKLAESLTTFLSDKKIKVAYLHSEIKTLERMDIINQLRKGEKDVLIGINLLREGLDIPEVQLVSILDADKEGFLRSEGALIQTIGRAARNAKGRVIMYADSLTESMRKAIEETNRRRKIQMEYNKKHGIIPKTIIKNIQDTISIKKKIVLTDDISIDSVPKQIDKLKTEMRIAVKNLDFEKAIEIRDNIAVLEKKLQRGN